MDADTQFQRRQSHFLVSRLDAGNRRLHFQRREAGTDRMLAIGRGQATNRHIGVADRLQLLQSVNSPQRTDNFN